MQVNDAQSDFAVAVDIRRVTKHYGQTVALSDMSLAILDNEFFTLLGPSGCGKTTLLRSIAGFESISAGEIHLFGQNLADLPPNRRPVNTVFQQYALFPHMSVTDNVLFGLQRQKIADAPARARAKEVLDMVQLSAFADRMPFQLSGGQQQRVALARALAPGPKVLLLDEPLSALDLKLRQDVRVELQQIQDDTGITFVFVTHDQEEAITMSDRIAVISDGRLQQVGTPQQIYEAPTNTFVADFIGETNFINVHVVSIEDETARCVLPGNSELLCTASAGASIGAGHLSVRPERIALTDGETGNIVGAVSRLTYLGTDVRVAVTLVDGSQVTVRVQNTRSSELPSIGATVGLRLEADAARLLVD